MKRKLLALCIGVVVLSVIVPAIGAEKHSALEPAHRHSWWTLRHWAVNERVRQGNVDMIFIGDSITHSWEGVGKEVWQKYYGHRNAVNMGFGGDRTQHVLWRLDNGNIDGISPKVAVIMIGTNNSNRDDNTSEEIAEGMIVPATHDEMGRIREARRILRERALMEAEDEGTQADEDGDDSYASAHPEEDPAES